MTTAIAIGETVKYNYTSNEVRTGEVVEFDALTNRYRVFWHTATYANGKSYSPNKRTWIKADALQNGGK